MLVMEFVLLFINIERLTKWIYNMDNILKLKDFRIDIGYTQQDIAKMLGCSVSAYSKYETGEREPSILVLIKLADLYRTSIDALVGRAPCNERVKSVNDGTIYSVVARLKKSFDISAAGELENAVAQRRIESLAASYDCLTVNDIYREIEFLLKIAGGSVKTYTKIFGVSRSGYYHWIQNGDVVRQRNWSIAQDIMQYELAALDSAGYRAVTMYLRSRKDKPEYASISVARVKRIMDEFEIISEDLRNKKNAEIQKVIGKYVGSKLPIAQNELALNFDYKVAPCTLWCTDITEVRTEEGKLFLCAVIDLCGRYLIGYSTGLKIDARMVRMAISDARKNAQKYYHLSEEPILLHSDRGTCFRKKSLLAYEEEFGMKPSMSRPQTPTDNACIESFFASLKCEYLYRYQLDSVKTARKMIERYIKFYNTVRVHQTSREIPFEYWRKYLAFQSEGNYDKM